MYQILLGAETPLGGVHQSGGSSGLTSAPFECAGHPATIKTQVLYAAFSSAKLIMALCLWLLLSATVFMPAVLLQGAPDRQFRGRVLVVVTCHADDFSIFAGGAIKELIDQGYTGYLVRVTDDEKSGGADPQHNAEQNDREVREVARMLGLSAVYSLNFKNDELGRVPHDRLRDAIMYYLRKLKADTVYTFDPYATYGEENPDHLIVGRAVEDAARNAGNPRYARDQILAGIEPKVITDAYYWSRAPFDVNTVRDISAYLDLKMEALSYHHAQFPESMVPYFRNHDEAIGEIYGMKAAEVSHRIEYLNAPAQQSPSLPPRAKAESKSPISPPGFSDFKDKTIVVISPHGRDYVEAAGGTIAKAVREGSRIYLVRVTDDERYAGDLPPIEARTRMEGATRKAAEILGIRQLIDLDLKDGEVAEVSEPELRARFAAIFRALAPDAIFTIDPWAPYDLDSDDARIGHAAEDAAWSASHISFYPELALLPKTNFKVIANRYFWSSNDAEQASNYHQDIRSTVATKSRALQVFSRVDPLLGGKSPATTESLYYYHAANPLDWFADWLANSPRPPIPPASSTLKIARKIFKKVLIITPEPADWVPNVAGTLLEMIRDRCDVALVSIGDGSKSGISPTDIRDVLKSVGISQVLHFGFREGELSSVPPLILRHRVVEGLHAFRPDTILVPDPWQHYVTNESTLVGHIASDAIYEWALEGAAGRILYWEANGAQGNAEFTGDMAQKSSLLMQLHLPGVHGSEQFHARSFGKKNL